MTTFTDKKTDFTEEQVEEYKILYEIVIPLEERDRIPFDCFCFCIRIIENINTSEDADNLAKLFNITDNKSEN
jgi:hypothetical protein